MDSWSDSILCSRNRPTYRCRRYRQHLFCRFSVQKLNHDIVSGTCKAVCDVFLAHNLYHYYTIYNMYNYFYYIIAVIIDGHAQLSFWTRECVSVVAVRSTLPMFCDDDLDRKRHNDEIIIWSLYYTIIFFFRTKTSQYNKYLCITIMYDVPTPVYNIILYCRFFLITTTCTILYYGRYFLCAYAYGKRKIIYYIYEKKNKSRHTATRDTKNTSDYYCVSV